MPLTPRDGLALVSAALAAVALGAAAWLGLGGGSEAAASASADPLASGPAAFGSPADTRSPVPASELLVDVQGGVARPGLVRLSAGARVADAIRAAGGYSADADLLAAASAVNLAATLSDGQQVFVPLLGVAVAGAGGGGSPGSAGGGLVNLNTATPEALDALPGIGPVTVQKIVDARGEQPFTTLDELVERKVMNRGQLDGIRELVTI